MPVCLPAYLLVQAPLPPRQARLRGDRDGQDRGGGLVPSLPPRTEHRPHRLQGRLPRARQEAGLPEQGPHGSLSQEKTVNSTMALFCCSLQSFYRV